MIHASMTPQQTVDAIAGLVLSDGTPQKVASLESLGDENMCKVGALEPEPVISALTQIELELHFDKDHRYKAFINAGGSLGSTSPQSATKKSQTSDKPTDSWGAALSDASAQALADFRRFSGL